jgi:hypothetical protein
MSEPEFYANATLGFRQWCLRWKAGGNEPPSLESLVKHGFHRPHCYRWNLEGPNFAACMRLEVHPDSSEAPGEVPGMRCSCGFYGYGRRNSSNSETTVHVVGGVVAGWGNLELHEGGFKCGKAKVLALFAPDPRKRYADYDGVAGKKWAALLELCSDNAIPLLEPDSLKDDEDIRHYACERDLALLEDQLNYKQLR